MKEKTDRMQEQLIALISPLVAPLGYEIVHLEVQTHRGKVLRIYIDHLEGASAKEAIGVEDCARVSRALDEPLDAMAAIDGVFHGEPYELEVSSPGVDRPLRQSKDYERFSGQEARIHVYRPLSAEELGNPGFQAKHPKQKNFLGVLKGVRDRKVWLALSKDDGEAGKPSGKKRAKPEAAEGEQVTIPLELISKANLEPRFEITDGKE